MECNIMDKLALFFDLLCKYLGIGKYWGIPNSGTEWGYFFLIYPLFLILGLFALLHFYYYVVMYKKFKFDKEFFNSLTVEEKTDIGKFLSDGMVWQNHIYAIFFVIGGVGALGMAAYLWDIFWLFICVLANNPKVCPRCCSF